MVLYIRSLSTAPQMKVSHQSEVEVVCIVMNGEGLPFLVRLESGRQSADIIPLPGLYWIL